MAHKVHHSTAHHNKKLHHHIAHHSKNAHKHLRWIFFLLLLPIAVYVALRVVNYTPHASIDPNLNLLKNGSFENATNNIPNRWTPQSGYSSFVSRAAPPQRIAGTYALKLTGSNNSTYEVTQLVDTTLVAGKRFDFSGHFMTLAASGDTFYVTVNLAWLNSAGQQIGITGNLIYATQGYTQWVSTANTSILPPTGTVKAKAVIKVTGISTGSAIYFDNFFFSYM